VVGATFGRLGDLEWAIGSAEAKHLRVQPHRYHVGDITVTGVSRRGHWFARGVVLVAWANDQVLAEVESQRPAAIVAVARWPDDIARWRSIYAPRRIGQARAEVEAEFDTATVSALHPRAAEAIDSVGDWVNQHRATLSTDEREAVAGALIALRDAGVPVVRDALRGHLMVAGWSGGLIDKTVELAERVASGRTPRHRTFRLG
jgi:hypothetical protein